MVSVLPRFRLGEARGSQRGLDDTTWGELLGGWFLTGLVNVLLWGLWISLSSICWRFSAIVGWCSIRTCTNPCFSCQCTTPRIPACGLCHVLFSVTLYPNPKHPEGSGHTRRECTRRGRCFSVRRVGPLVNAGPSHQLTQPLSTFERSLPNTFWHDLCPFQNNTVERYTD